MKRLRLEGARVFSTGYDRPNIRYLVEMKERPMAQLLAFLAGRKGESGIVYAASRKRVEQVCERLQAEGYRAAAYHAGLGNRERQAAQDAFLKDDIDIVVATVAFGMGIDKPDVRFVVHYDVPKNIESYYQETGRAGRDGLPATALLLFGYQDLALARGLIEQGRNEERKRIELHKLAAMAGYGEATGCRRRVLLNYFGETPAGDCGNCDVCLDPPETEDVTVEAQKALSCVYRLRQRFGLMYVIDVLRGSKNKRILAAGHDRLSTYGIGSDRPKEFWAGLIRHLIHHGYLIQDEENYSVLKLTPAATPLLRGETRLEMARPRRHTERKKGPAAPAGDYDRGVFEALRILRKEIADREGVPPFVVFGNRTLVEMAASMPETEEDLLAITGVGAHKLEKYGRIFLERIRELAGNSG